MLNPVCSLHFQKADLAVGDLTITYEREQGVDFTMPFMNLGGSSLEHAFVVSCLIRLSSGQFWHSKLMVKGPSDRRNGKIILLSSEL